MDNKDKQLLNILKENSNLTTRQIAKKTNIPITTVHKRIKKLKEKNIIKRYTIELNYPLIERELGAYILISCDLKILKEKHKTQYDIASELKKIPSIERVDIVTGGTDIISFLQVKGVHELDKLLLGKIQLIDGIIKTQTLMVLH